MTNQWNEQEWDKLRKVIDDTLVSQPIKFWKDKFKNTDACVTEIYSEVKSIKKKLFKGVVTKPAPKDFIWNQLKSEIKLKEGITVVPLAKL